MKVWVVEAGEYDGRDVAGVYASIKAVIDAYPTPERYVALAGKQRRFSGWHPNIHDSDYWWNGLNGSAAVVAQAHEVHGLPSALANKAGPAPP